MLKNYDPNTVPVMPIEPQELAKYVVSGACIVTVVLDPTLTVAP